MTTIQIHDLVSADAVVVRKMSHQWEEVTGKIFQSSVFLLKYNVTLWISIDLVDGYQASEL